MDSPDIYKIKMYLNNMTRDSIYTSNIIPIFTEDKEARIFLDIILEYYANSKSEFSSIKRFFHLVDANIGANNLLNIFNDSYLLKSTMQSICILDGDQRSKHDYSKYIIILPGDDSPEKLIMNYSLQLLASDDIFLRDDTILNLNYGKVYYNSNIKPDIESIDNSLQALRDNNKSTHGVEREIRKNIFIKHQRFFELLFRHWVNNTNFKQQMDKFYSDLYIMFKKVAEFHGINPNEWQCQQ